MRDAALRYARRGVAVFPLVPEAKRPLTRHGFKDASSDVEQIEAWWQQHPTANIGIAVPGTHVVVDLDDPRIVATIESQHGALPATRIAATGGGGAHYWYRLPQGRRVKNRVRVMEGVDTRTEGGYVVAPPSVHQSGQRYRWIADVEAVEAPDWLVDLLDPPQKPKRRKPPTPPAAQRAAGNAYARRALESEVALVAHAPEGTRNDTLNSASFNLGQLVGGGALDEVEVRNALEHAADQAGLGAREASKTIASGMSAGAKDPRSAPEPTKRAWTAPGEQPPPKAEEVDNEWESRLVWKTNADGSTHLKSCIHNAMLFVAHDPRWRGKLAWNEFTQSVEVCAALPRSTGEEDRGPFPRAWGDNDDLHLAGWLGAVPKIRMSPERSGQIALAVAPQRSIHPVRDYLRELEWDGVERLRDWLEVFMGVAPSDYASFVGTWWMIAAVARVMRPGCKVDNVLILEGPQGLRKSTALRVLAGEKWFCDTNFDLGSKDAYMALRGNWIVEMAELDALGRVAASRAKSFFSSPVDTYRPPYGRNIVSVPRQCVFAGTVNPDGGGYLKDSTGNRRYWPVACRRIELRGLAVERDQLWAEAVARFDRGERWYPANADERAMCAHQQSQRAERDGWEELVATWLEEGPGRAAIKQRRVTTTVVLLECIKMPKDRINRTARTRVGTVMSALGYVSKKVQSGGKRRRVYVKEDR